MLLEAFTTTRMILPQLQPVALFHGDQAEQAHLVTARILVCSCSRVLQSFFHLETRLLHADPMQRRDRVVLLQRFLPFAALKANATVANVSELLAPIEAFHRRKRAKLLLLQRLRRWSAFNVQFREEKQHVLRSVDLAARLLDLFCEQDGLVARCRRKCLLVHYLQLLLLLFRG